MAGEGPGDDDGASADPDPEPDCPPGTPEVRGEVDVHASAGV